jgi:hypothetical protein
MKKVKEALREGVSYTQDLICDEGLRSDIRSALVHGAQAGDRVRRDIDVAEMTSRLASDRHLRRNVRELLDDLDSAGDRIRRRPTRRLRSAFAIAIGSGVIVAVVLPVRRWLGDHASGNGRMSLDASAG